MTTNVSSSPVVTKRRRSRFAIEWRRKSRRTESGWTKWTHYIVAETRHDAERLIASGWMQSWMATDESELRIVDRDAA